MDNQKKKRFIIFSFIILLMFSAASILWSKLFLWTRPKYSTDIQNESAVAMRSSKTASSSNFYFDFETAEGLSGIETIKQTTAHSGEFAVDLTGGKEYGPAFTKKIKDVSERPLKKIALSVWIYPYTNNSNTVLTASISTDKNETVFWQGKSSENKNFLQNKWTKINALFIIPEDKIDPENLISVSVWNKGKTDVLADDLEIVYGENIDRRGISSKIDGAAIYEKRFIPQKNHPPFKTIYFQKEEINNGGQTFLLPEKSASADFSPNDIFLSGNFSADKNGLDEVLCFKNNQAGLFGYSLSQKQFIKLWESTGSDSLWNNNHTAYSGDFNNDGRCGILLVNKTNKNWRLLYFDDTQWTVKQSGSAAALKKEWTTADPIPDDKLFSASDIIYKGDYTGGDSGQLLKLNNDWRFDLKLIEQEKDGFEILGTVDFKGYPDDHNPKYYEFVKIVSGKFLSRGHSSLLIMMRNCADNDFNGRRCKQFENIADLPNSTQVYNAEELNDIRK